MAEYVDSLPDASDYKGLASTCTLALAEVLMHCGKWDESLESFKVALPVQQDVEGIDHIDSIRAANLMEKVRARIQVREEVRLACYVCLCLVDLVSSFSTAEDEWR